MVERVSGYLEQPKATVLAEAFEEMLPALVNTVEALKMAKEGRAREAQRIITNFGSEAVMKLQQSQLDFDRTLDEQEAKRRPRRKAKGRRPRDGTP